MGELSLRPAFIVTYNKGKLCPIYPWAHSGLAVTSLQHCLSIKKLILIFLVTGSSLNAYGNDTTM